MLLAFFLACLMQVPPGAVDGGSYERTVRLTVRSPTEDLGRASRVFAVVEIPKKFPLVGGPTSRLFPGDEMDLADADSPLHLRRTDDGDLQVVLDAHVDPTNALPPTLFEFQLLMPYPEAIGGKTRIRRFEAYLPNGRRSKEANPEVHYQVILPDESIDD